MARLSEGSPEARRIDGALAEWRQGDLALSERWFVHAADPSCPLTAASAEAEGEIQAIASEVDGLVVVSQSCDIVRPCTDRPFIEVSPLVEVVEAEALRIDRGYHPAYATVPAVRDRRLVAHLDRTMTVEKAVVARWERTAGCRTDEEARRFAQALTRKRARAAFPDDFNELAAKLQDRLREKHDRQSAEGEALRALREIRVRAAPSWEADRVEVTFWFIRNHDEPASGTTGWDAWLEKWLELIPPSGRYERVDGVVVALEDLTAQDYVESDLLDLDHLSTRRR